MAGAPPAPQTPHIDGAVWQARLPNNSIKEKRRQEREAQTEEREKGRKERGQENRGGRGPVPVRPRRHPANVWREATKTQNEEEKKTDLWCVNWNSCFWGHRGFRGQTEGQGFITTMTLTRTVKAPRSSHVRAYFQTIYIMWLHVNLLNTFEMFKNVSPTFFMFSNSGDC